MTVHPCCCCCVPQVSRELEKECVVSGGHCLGRDRTLGGEVQGGWCELGEGVANALVDIIEPVLFEFAASTHAF